MDIPEDIILKILLRLPAKSFVRFKLVCKSWRSHISNPNFVKKHVFNTRNNPNNDFVIGHSRYNGFNQLYLLNVNNSHDRPTNLNIPMSIPDDPSFYVVGSCNGLLCLAYNCNYGSDTLQREQYIWNPATGQVKETMCMINFDPESSNVCVSLGFGFDHASDDYKVVRIVTYHHQPAHVIFQNRVEVYSLNKDAWIEIDEEFEFELGDEIKSISPVFVNGSIYWMVFQKNSSVDKLLSFNLQTEKFCTISLPANNVSSLWFDVFDDVFVFKGSVAVAIPGEKKNEDIDIWTLDDDKSWIKKLTMKSPLVTSVVGCLKTGEFVGRLDSSGGKLVFYNSVQNKVVKPTHFRMETFRTYNYSESLESWN